MNIIAHTSEIDRARAGLQEVQARIEDLVAQRDALITTATAELIAAGVDARVVSQDGYTNPIGEGETGACYDTYHIIGRKVLHRAGIDRIRGDRPRGLGPYVLWDDYFIVEHGTYQVLLVDGDDALIAKVPGADDEEGGHRMAVGRLRTLARRDHMRIRARDLAIEVIDPMNNVVHTGTVITAFAFLQGIDLDADA